jgi:hypothetical protein
LLKEFSSDIRPFNGCCFAIVGTDVAHNFAIEIFDRTEDATGDEVSLDFGESDFDLVEPGGVSGRVMNTHFGGDEPENHRPL